LPPLLVDEKTAAELLGVSKRTVFELNEAGELSCKRIGSRKLYSVARLREFADGGTN
jgi:excisionase family DNA binding protein